jgi:NAD(P)-dependent dehydrogenase (short-subunit alcohol dehydrogenase family)
MPKREQRTALVTGANKGIGFEVARQLARKGFHVFLGARNADAGRAAAEKLQSEKGSEKERDSTPARSSVGENVVTFLEIDVSNPDSVRRAAEELSQHTDHLDTLVNNAGIAMDEDKDVLRISIETFETTLRTNTLGALVVSQAFLSLLKKSVAPRIVNVSSGGGQLADGADGWAPAYCISKTALNGVTSQLAAALPNFAVNSVCPGWVRTDMGGRNATRSIAEGAAGIVWLAAEAPQKETGKFWRDRKVIPW